MRRLTTWVILAIMLLAITPVGAHRGNTDANGGHYSRSTGEYHYHHGYPAHGHPNGVCPYDYDDKTASSSNISSSKKETTTSSSKVNKEEDKKRTKKSPWLSVSNWILVVLLALMCAPSIIDFIWNRIEDLRDYIKEKRQ